jgi:HEAT repeats
MMGAHSPRWFITLRRWRLLAVACVMMPLLSVAQDEPKHETIEPWRIQALVAALDGPYTEVRRVAIRWLSEKDVSDQRLADKVGVLLTDNRWNKNRAEVLAALASSGKDGAKFAPQVAEVLKDQNATVRASAALALELTRRAFSSFHSGASAGIVLRMRCNRTITLHSAATLRELPFAHQFTEKI